MRFLRPSVKIPHRPTETILSTKACEAGADKDPLQWCNLAVRSSPSQTGLFRFLPANIRDKLILKKFNDQTRNKMSYATEVVVRLVRREGDSYYNEDQR